MEEVVVTLRIDNQVGELLLEVVGKVESEQNTTALLGFMSSLLTESAQYGGKWIPSTKLIENVRNQVVFTLAFPNTTAREQFYLKLQELGQETVP